jgi:SAM-dependent methyltransferase
MIEQGANDTSNREGASAPSGMAAAVLDRPAGAHSPPHANRSPSLGGIGGLDGFEAGPLTAERLATNQRGGQPLADTRDPEGSGDGAPAGPPPPVQTTESIVRPSHAGLAEIAAGGGPQLPDPASQGGFALEDWFATPQGAYVLSWELARVDQVVADIFGYYAVQVGLPGIDFLRANRMPNRLTASLRGNPSVVADAHELPFDTESLDLVVLPHLLEFSSEPHQILREVERVLRPEGQVVILCFNPVSMWGVKKLFAAPPHAPWSGEFVSVLRMKDWLKLLNFEMRGGRFGCYRPPYTSEKWLARFGFLEKAGDRWWPVAGAVYLMQAKKRVPGMRIITPSWRKERRKAEALAPSTNGANRGTHHIGYRAVTHAPSFVHHQQKPPKDTE